jgi:uncharacterized protein (DUF433 family)
MTPEAAPAWPSAPGATISEKTASKEFGLTHEQVVQAIKDGKLQHVVSSAYGRPCIKLVRQEVEALVRSMHGDVNIDTTKLKAELAKVTTELLGLKRKVMALEKRKAELEKRKAELEKKLGR